MTRGALPKLVVSLALVAILLWLVDWGEVGAMLRRTDPRYLALSVAAGILLNVVSAWKWQILLRAKGHHLPLGRLVHLYFVGYFFNHLLPSNVGGDVVRSYEISREIGSLADAVASVFMERFTGFTALMALAALSFMGNLGTFDDWRFSAALLVGLAAYAGLCLAVALEGPADFLARGRAGRLFGRVAEKVKKLQRSIRSYRHRKGHLLAALAISALFYLLAILNVFVSTLAFGIHVPIGTLVVIVPVIMVISMIPVSLGGIGLAEGAYVFTFTTVGAGAPAGMLVALLTRFKALLFGFVGGATYGFRTARWGEDDHEGR